MSTYSMAQISTLTGISAHTLRIWERRYGFLKPKRTDTNIRYYSDEELRKLLNIGILMRNGFKVSQIDQLSNTEIHEAVSKIMEDPSNENKDEIDSLTMSTLKMNEHEFDNVFQRQVINKGLLHTVTDIIYPFLTQVGVLWGTSKVIPAQEHFITNLIRQKMIAAIEKLPAPPAHAPGILMFLLEGEDHEIGILLASYIAKELGFRVYYLGQNVPLENIGNALEISKAQYMLTMFVVLRPQKIRNFIKTLREFTSIPILVSGTPENFSEAIRTGDFNYIQRPDELVSLLKAALIEES